MHRIEPQRRANSITSKVIARMTGALDTEPLNMQRIDMQRSLLTIVLALFGALSAMALWQHGYWGLLEPHFKTFGAGQVLADLVIAVTLAMVWMWHDAKTTGRNVWPWIALSIVAGSFGPLLYLLTAKRKATA
jgi:hypothetical protein